MPLSLSDGTAQLVGVVTVDEAEPLAQWLRETPAPKVALKRCTTLHTAALQALLAARPEVVTPPRDPFLVTWVLPLLDSEDDEAEADEAEDDEAEAEAAPVEEPDAAAEHVDEFADVELDESLVLPEGLAALAEPDDLLA